MIHPNYDHVTNRWAGWGRGKGWRRRGKEDEEERGGGGGVGGGFRKALLWCIVSKKAQAR